MLEEGLVVYKKILYNIASGLAIIAYGPQGYLT